MKKMSSRQSLLLRTGIACALVALSLGAPAVAVAKSSGPPPLVISDGPLPAELQNRIYARPARVPEITPAQVSGASYFKDSDVGTTVVSRKIDELRNDLFSLQGKVSELSEQLASIEDSGQSQAAEYYASIATISTQLQSGTTPGNPRLVEKLNVARDNLEKLSANIARLNDLAMAISNAASMSSFLLESSRAAYGLSGAIEEDHVRLAQLEDTVNSTIVVIDRLLNNVNDDITRTVAYIGSERENLRTLSLAVSTGGLFGKSLSNRPFSHVQRANFAAPASSSGMMQPAIGGYDPAPQQPQAPAALPGGPRPLVKIRFDKPDVAYEQPVYMAVNEALARYPNARFELVAVHPSMGNAAETAIESTRARRNAERVLRSLTQMGLDMSRVDLSYTPSAEAKTSEVHLYVR